MDILVSMMRMSAGPATTLPGLDQCPDDLPRDGFLVVQQSRAGRAVAAVPGAHALRAGAHTFQVITLVLVLLVTGVLYAVEHNWPGFRRIGRWWLRRGDAVKDWVRRAPLTYLYLVLLTFTTWLLWNTNGRLRAAFLAQQSTNPHELSTKPVTVLLRSAMYVTPMELVLWWALFSVVVARLEHRFGWQRVLVGFAVGHVGATVSVALLQQWGPQVFPVPALSPAWIDVGASYGFFALAALATYHGTTRRRVLWVVGLVAVAAGGLLLDFGWTAIGHAIAVLLGWACARLVNPDAALRHEARTRALRLSETEH